jgi:hypothetical protein
MQISFNIRSICKSFFFLCFTFAICSPLGSQSGGFFVRFPLSLSAFLFLIFRGLDFLLRYLIFINHLDLEMAQRN